MLTKLLTKLRPTEEERIAKAKLRLVERYAGNPETLWRVVTPGNKELAAFSGSYLAVLKWAFEAPGFFENGKSGDVIPIFRPIVSNSRHRDGEDTFTRRAMRLPNGH